ncbi:MAG: 3-deoxy-7-phosphoheptulonate synthase [Verrucomicrobiales bacterium]|jgi:3-deoxy-7-phosphoheptulonate synthase|nr:3-deoxy-7-phosphoheptulonate synthase [Verrucomicrobiales bacterium]
MKSSSTSRVSDLNVDSNVPLPAPALLCHEIRRTEEQAQFVAKSREQIKEIIFGEDPRLLVILGPCSIHCLESGKEYADKLSNLADKVSDKLLLVMRVYFEKPRTTVGWKGLIMDPELDGTDNIPEGLRIARSFLSQVIDSGVPTATELLDPITPQYIADLICWSAVGARTTESQTHRQMASGLSMPLGFKNGTNGSILPAVNAIKAATSPQTFLGISQEGIASAVSTNGNPHCHIILRGGEDGPNYETGHVKTVANQLEDKGLQPAIMIDASHDNSGKNHENQPEVFRNIIAQRADGDNNVIGAMLESNIVSGSQKFPQPVDSLTYGQSITDKCIDWEITEEIILEAASKL